MLTELSIRNFAIIEHLTLEFNEGLTVLTGETGAGKSIIIDAIQLLTGGRGSTEYIRHGANKATLEGLFLIHDKKHEVYTMAEKYGLELNSDGMLILHRTISQNGKSICRINGSLVTLAILREFGKVLIDIHTQHETQSLMDVDRHLRLLDMYFHDQLDDVLKDYQKIYHKLNTLKNRIEQFNFNEQEIAQRLDLLNFQIHELRQAELVPGEDESLQEERDRLANFEKIYQSIQESYNALHGEQKGLDWLSLALNSLETASSYEPGLNKSKEEFSNYYYLIEELSYQLRQYLEGFEFDPERLNVVESRLSELNRLKKKYGSNVNAMLEYAAKIEDEIDQLQNRDQSIQQLAEQIKELSEDALAEARHLHELRQQAAKKLVDTIEKELKDLYLEKATFQVEIQLKQQQDGGVTIDGQPVQLGPTGIDRVQFLLSTNSGEPVKPLNKVASGGELSRIMLALKKIFAKHQGVTSVIFDEVDTGVSGRVAQAIAEKIYRIATGSQVLCITHLPQVAAMADHHVLIEKEMDQSRTLTKVRLLDHQERVEEIGRMITGSALTQTSIDHANELIHHANDYKT
ncbi:DNA repair protein RecN [Amphibacillus sediminis]|uniref:DNA repair protein RecN n=1 Tax=Amphibacillus sediminis TaxID=360185 RepID=UPI00082C79C5|nr:DNA repair protein RecN [Amphibacillus sediminis]